MKVSNGGRLSYSSDEVSVMEMEQRTKLVQFQNNLQSAAAEMINYLETKSQPINQK